MSGLMDELPRFRAPKRRKANKPAVSEDGFSGDDSHQERGIPHATADEAYTEEDESVLIRTQRKPTSLRKGGVSFTATAVTSSLQQSGESSLVMAGDHASDTTQQRQNRFVAPTGQVVDIDRHIQTNPANIGRTAYIDSRLSRQKQDTSEDNQQEGHFITRDHFHERHDHQKKQQSERQTLSTVPSTRSSTVMHGNSASSVQAYLLSEVAIAKIDTGNDAAAAGTATSAAKAGDPATATTAAAATRMTTTAAPGKGPATRRKMKPGRGKPRRPRQRPEQDIARDALVEKLLAEHAPGGHYSGPGEPATENAKESKEDEEGKEAEKESDEAFAARFRASFFDRASERRGRGGGGGGGGGGGSGGPGGGSSSSAADKDKTKINSGPKLGGSRSDKAKMAMVMAKKQQQQQRAGAGAGGGGAG